MSINNSMQWQHIKPDFSGSSNTLANAARTISNVGDTFGNITDKMDKRRQEEELKSREQMMHTAKTMDDDAYTEAFDPETGVFNAETYKQNIQERRDFLKDSDIDPSQIEAVTAMFDVRGNTEKGNQWNIEQNKFKMLEDENKYNQSQRIAQDDIANIFNNIPRRPDGSYDLNAIDNVYNKAVNTDKAFDPSVYNTYRTQADAFNTDLTQKNKDFLLREKAFNKAQADKDNDNAFNIRTNELIKEMNSNKTKLNLLNNKLKILADSKGENSSEYKELLMEKNALLDNAVILSYSDVYSVLGGEFPSQKMHNLIDLANREQENAIARDKANNFTNKPYTGTKTLDALAQEWDLSNGTNTITGISNEAKKLKAAGNALLSLGTTLSEEDIASYLKAQVDKSGHWFNTKNKLDTDGIEHVLKNGKANYSNPFTQQFLATYYNDLPLSTRKEFLQHAKLEALTEQSKQAQKDALMQKYINREIDPLMSDKGKHYDNQKLEDRWGLSVQQFKLASKEAQQEYLKNLSETDKVSFVAALRVLR